jgi:predicted nucleotidyltransferase
LLSFYHALYRVRSPEACKDTAEWNGGLAGHISRTARETATPEAFFEALRTKQYTDARLRRALLFGALEVTDEDVKAWPSYTTLLAANLRGRAYLKEWKRQSKSDGHGFRVVTKPADAPEGRQRDLSESADALFTLCLPRPADAGALLRRGPCLYP